MPSLKLVSLYAPLPRAGQWLQACCHVVVFLGILSCRIGGQGISTQVGHWALRFLRIFILDGIIALDEDSVLMG